MARREGQVSLKNIFDNLLGEHLGEMARGVAAAALPNCSACAKKAIPLKCTLCGSYVCQDHGYVCVGRFELICRPCILELRKGEDLELDPWEVLELREDEATKVGIERSFRRKARGCHPDRYPDDKEKAAEWRQLQWAREIALEELEER